MAWCRYRTSCEEDEAIISSTTAGPRQKVAARLLRIEKAILRGAPPSTHPERDNVCHRLEGKGGQLGAAGSQHVLNMTDESTLSKCTQICFCWSSGRSPSGCLAGALEEALRLTDDRDEAVRGDARTVPVRLSS